VVRTGTASRSSRQIEEDLRTMGANLACSAGADSSAISFSGLTEFAGGLLALVADLAQGATFPADEFERERRQRIEELRIERTTPGFLAGERLRQVLFGAHPYSIAAPTEVQVESYRREQLVEFHRQNYVPDRALLIAVGDFASENMLQQIEKTFAQWAGSPPARPEFPAPTKATGRRVHLVHLPGTVQTQVLVGNLAITRRHPDWLPLTLAHSIYGGAFNSRLVMNIREQKGYAYAPRSQVSTRYRDAYWVEVADVTTNVTGPALEEIFKEIEALRAEAPPADELRGVQNYLAGTFVLQNSSRAGIAGQLASVRLHGLGDDYLTDYVRRVHGVTAADVQRVARHYLVPERMLIVITGDLKQIEEQVAPFRRVTNSPD